jgi:hypothetical protein
MKKHIKNKEPGINNSQLSQSSVLLSPKAFKRVLVIWVAVFITISSLHQMKPSIYADAISKQRPSNSKEMQAP